MVGVVVAGPLLSISLLNLYPSFREASRGCCTGLVTCCGCEGWTPSSPELVAASSFPAPLFPLPPLPPRASPLSLHIPERSRLSRAVPPCPHHGPSNPCKAHAGHRLSSLVRPSLRPQRRLRTQSAETVLSRRRLQTSCRGFSGRCPSLPLTSLRGQSSSPPTRPAIARRVCVSAASLPCDYLPGPRPQCFSHVASGRGSWPRSQRKGGVGGRMKENSGVAGGRGAVKGQLKRGRLVSAAAAEIFTLSRCAAPSSRGRSIRCKDLGPELLNPLPPLPPPVAVSLSRH